PDQDTIQFKIDTVPTITPVAPLPAITQPVILDGTTQLNYNGVPLVKIDGALVGPTVGGLVFTADGNQVYGLTVLHFAGPEIRLQGGNGSTLVGNVLGDTSGQPQPVIPGAVGLLVVNSSNNVVGGPATVNGFALSGNVITGNAGDG